MSFGGDILIEPGPGGPADAAVRMPDEIAALSPGALFWRRFRADRVAVASAVIVVVFILIAIAAPLIVSILGLPGPNTQNTNLLSGAFGQATGPTSADPFGVDSLGRDVLSRIVYGLRISLEVGIFGTAIAAFIGTVVGLAAGFFGKWVDTILMRIVDVFLAFPVIVLGLGISDACSGSGCFKVGGSALIRPGIGTVMFIIALSSFTYIARIVRGQVLSIREKEFVEASKSLGASNWRILLRDVLPNLTTPLIVYSSLLIPANILFEAALSFLGVGIQPPTASLGSMISSAGDALLEGQPLWWQMVFPGAALLILVLAFNMLGDGLLDALSPRRED